MKRTWAEINIDALKYNAENIRKITNPHAKIAAVVKADAYGHGYKRCCKALLECGVDYFCVAMVSEAVQLRRAGFDIPILILGAAHTEDAESIVEYDLMPNVYNYKFAEVLSKTAVEKNKIVKVHIKIDTGMSRVGFVAGDDNSEIIREIVKISKLDNIKIEGIFSHFACADEENPDYTYAQFEKFMKVISELENEGIKIPIRHIANSGAIMMYPEMHLDMVRPGIILYGYYPSDEVDKKRLSLKPVMSMKTKITQVKETDEGVGVSYGKTYITDKKTRIATIPVGYADGYLRCLSHKAKVEIGGELCNIIGRICMDQCMIDVTTVNNITIGDEVILFGDSKITADDVAGWMNTISYEVLCLVSKRIPRLYKEKGRENEELNYLDEI